MFPEDPDLAEEVDSRTERPNPMVEAGRVLSDPDGLSLYNVDHTCIIQDCSRVELLTFLLIKYFLHNYDLITLH